MGTVSEAVLAFAAAQPETIIGPIISGFVSWRVRSLLMQRRYRDDLAIDLIAIQRDLRDAAEPGGNWGQRDDAQVSNTVTRINRQADTARTYGLSFKERIAISSYASVVSNFHQKFLRAGNKSASYWAEYQNTRKALIETLDAMGRLDALSDDLKRQHLSDHPVPPENLRARDGLGLSTPAHDYLPTP